MPIKGFLHQIMSASNFCVSCIAVFNLSFVISGTEHLFKKKTVSRGLLKVYDILKLSVNFLLRANYKNSIIRSD